MLRKLLLLLLCLPAYAQLLPVDTAIVVTVGPLVDDTDFKTLETSIAYNATGMSVDLIESTGSASTKTDLTLTTASTNDWTHIGNGIYEIELTAAQNNTEGNLQVVGVCDGVLPFFSPIYTVVPSAVYNAIALGSDNLQVDTIQIEGVDATNQINTEADTALADYDPPTNTEMEARTLAASAYFDPAADTVANVTTLAGHTPQTADHAASIAAILADTAAVDTTAELQTLLMGSAIVPASASSLATAQSDLDTLIAGVTLAASQPNYAPATAASLATHDGKLDTVDSIVDSITTNIGASGAGLSAIPWNAAWDAEVQSEATDALIAYDPATGAEIPSTSTIADAVWDELISGHSVAGSTAEALNAAGSAGDPWTTALPGSYTGSQAGNILASILTDSDELQTDWTNGGRLDLIIDELTTQGDTNQTDLNSILADSNELQTDWTNGGRLDLIIDELTTQGDTNQTDLNSILANTNDLADGQRLDLIIDELTTQGDTIETDTNELQTRFNNMIEADGPDWRFTLNSLEEAPSGSSSATLANQEDLIDKVKGLMSKDHTLVTAVGTFDPSTDSNESLAETVASLTGGSGNVIVNADSDPSLYYKTAEGDGIEAAIVQAYLKSDYDAGNYNIKAQTTTKADGSWTSNFMLNSGVEYTILFYKPGAYGPDTVDYTP